MIWFEKFIKEDDTEEGDFFEVTDDQEEVLDKLSDKGKTVILVTHEQYTAEYAERIIKLKDGVIVSDSHDHKRRKQGLEK